MSSGSDTLLLAVSFVIGFTFYILFSRQKYNQSYLVASQNRVL